MTHPMRILAAISVAVLGSACGDAGGGGVADSGPAANVPLDAGAVVADAAPVPAADAAPSIPDATLPPDAAPDTALPDAAPDAGPPAPTCIFPAPGLAPNLPPEIVAARERAGQTAYTWLDDPGLGQVVDRRVVLRPTAAAIAALAASQHYPLPRPATHDTVVEQIRYVTQDRGVFTEATALVAYPVDSDPEHPAPILAVLHGTSGFTDACAPSNGLDVRALAAVFASVGYIAVAPDYIGMRAFGEPSDFIHPYLVAEPTAIASLDSIRAAARMTDVLCAQPRVALFGGSQGGHAALWTERFAPYYAPELDLVGTVATVPPADLVGEMERALTSVVPATANCLAFLAAASDWYGLLGRLGEVLKPPFDTRVPEVMRAGCDFSSIDAPRALPELFQPALLDAAAGATLPDLLPWGAIVAENGLTTTSIPRLPQPNPAYGILAVFGEGDTLVTTPIERDAMAELCRQGMPIVGMECQGASHTQATAWSLPEIMGFIDARFAGTPLDPAATCRPFEPVRCQGSPASP